MPVKLNSSGGGSVTLTTPSTATDYTATFPANTGNVVTDSATQTLTNKTLNGAVMTAMASSVITSGTAQASTSGTSIDFTGIPSWVKRVTVMFSGVSTNGTSALLVQLGDSGGIENTGYVSTSIQATLTDSSTAGFIIRSATATNLFSGSMVIMNINGNEWVSDHVVKQSTTANAFGAGDKTLSATLDRVRITTVGGTDTFDAGSINILYE
jgi:hypothetical protein